MTSQESKPQYPIIVIGAGIGGLAVSILLAQNGQAVTVLERRSASYISNSSGGICLWNNAVRIVTGVMGLASQLADIADETDGRLGIDHATGETSRRRRFRR